MPDPTHLKPVAIYAVPADMNDARFDSTCSWCDERLYPYQRQVMSTDGWVHQRCAREWDEEVDDA